MQPLRERILGLLEAAKFDRMAYEDFYEEFMTILAEQRLHTRDPDWLASDWQAQEYRSNAVVVLLRLLASAYLRINESEYTPFIYQTFQPPINDSTNQTPMQQFCQRYVECLGQESDQIHIIAISKALGCTVDIAYLDGNASMDLTHLVFGAEDASDWSIPGLPRIFLLYRPGHYDLLYHGGE